MSAISKLQIFVYLKITVLEVIYYILLIVNVYNSLSLWRGLYCCYETGPHPQELMEEVAGSLRQQNVCIQDHIKYLEQVSTYTCTRVTKEHGL